MRRAGAWQRQVYWLLVLPAAGLMGVFYLYPLVEVLWISVVEPRPGLGNYALLFTSPSIQRTLWTTARIALVTTAVAIALGYVVAYALVTGSPRRQRLMFFGVLITFWMSVLVRAFAWVTLLRGEGPINGALRGLGLIAEPLPLVRNEFGVTVGMVHYMLPYAILPLYANMRTIDWRLVAAARGLGASPTGAFWQVFFPLSRPGLVGATILVFIFSLGFLITPAILGGGKTLMIAEYIRVQIVDLLRWGTGTMLASALMILTFLLVGLLSRAVGLRRLFGAT